MTHGTILFEGNKNGYNWEVKVYNSQILVRGRDEKITSNVKGSEKAWKQQFYPMEQLPNIKEQFGF